MRCNFGGARDKSGKSNLSAAAIVWPPTRVCARGTIAAQWFLQGGASFTDLAFFFKVTTAVSPATPSQQNVLLVLLIYLALAWSEYTQSI